MKLYKIYVKKTKQKKNYNSECNLNSCIDNYI